MNRRNYCAAIAVFAATLLAVGVPELRRYRLRYVETDDPIGDYSDVITVTTVP